MKIVETKSYDVFTEIGEFEKIKTAINELDEVLKLFYTVRLLTFNDYDDEITVDKEDVREIKNLLEALLANEVEGIS